MTNARQDTQTAYLRSPEARFPLSIEQGQLKASQPVEGAFFIHPTLLRDEDHAPWSIRLQFSSNAFVHKTLECARYKLPLLRDWKPGTSARLEINAQEDLAWELGTPACADLLEAVYASGRSGWEEAELIALLGCADDAMNPWLLLRALRDAGIVKPHLRSGWKGRVWTLNEPSIVEGHCGGQALAVVEGALCTRLIEDFRLAVEGLGGVAFRLRRILLHQEHIIRLSPGDEAVALQRAHDSGDGAPVGNAPAENSGVGQLEGLRFKPRQTEARLQRVDLPLACRVGDPRSRLHREPCAFRRRAVRRSGRAAPSAAADCAAGRR